VKAHRIQEKVKGIGFEWDHKDQVWEKVIEELQEFRKEDIENSDQKEEEFGDLLFSLVNYARFTNINAENALSITNQKFVKRFQLMEELATQDGIELKNLCLEEMDVYWEKAKTILKQSKN
jgi:XTP/dITP diphosphohydrolase